MKTFSFVCLLGLITILLSLGCSNSSEPELLSVADPEIMPADGVYSIPQLITIICSTPGASIYYSINGEEPNIESTIYTEPFTLSASCTVKARAFKDGYTHSAVVTRNYAINLETVSPPVFSHLEGSYNGIQTISITCATADATIRYTTDGTAPNENSALYTLPLTLSATTILGARAYKENCITSHVVYSLYNIDLTPPLEMILVPSGAVTMGDTRGEGYNDDQYPTHTINMNSFLPKQIRAAAKSVCSSGWFHSG